MAKRMLIDATHPEETRVVVVNGTRLEQLDVEASSKKQLKGNIYLAKVVRVEPSLQAAFVDYGGNRHGFLAFSEIHPDYYQIPVADRQALLDSQEQDDDEAGDGDGDVETLGGEDAEEVRPRRRKSGRDYKIQEVIKRRQIMLVQVVKEERGNKGAALTTWLSLAGRYCVLMPNTARGGGVSRKITNVADRKRLKSVMAELDIPKIMAVIVRTAGQERSKAEIKRDYEYLMRTWNHIRETTLESRAPCLIHEEANLIKRAIRDVYTSDIEEVLVDGEEGYRLAKDFMKTLTPSHAKKVQPYREQAMPLFHRFQVDSQLDAMHSPTVQLRSGGYIVINQTEALVAIDVNSGRATKERHIEETAVKTNLEAADEVARQLRLRDLAGLIVIDFIDMEENRNNASVERRLKDALRQDRARIQMGRISPFGLMEMSRQRLRPSLMETSFETCPHCAGAGMVRSVESAAMHILRVIEEEGVRRRSSDVTVHVGTPVALYILNQKRRALAEIEARYDFSVTLQGDDSLIVPDYRMERIKSETPGPAPEVEVVTPSIEAEVTVRQDEDEDEDKETVSTREGEANGDGNGDGKRRRKRRKRRRRPGSEEGSEFETGETGEAQLRQDESGDDDEDASAEDTEGEPEGDGDDGKADGKRRRRSRRGGRRRRRPGDEGSETGTDTTGTGEQATPDAVEAAIAEAESPAPEGAPLASEQAEDVPRPGRRRVRRSREKSVDDKVSSVAAATPVAGDAQAATPAAPEAAPEAAPQAETTDAGEDKPKPRRRSRRKAADAEAAPAAEVPLETTQDTPAGPVSEEATPEAAPVEVEAAPEPQPEPEAAAPDEDAAATPANVGEPVIEDRPIQVQGATPDDAPRRKGWWQKLIP